MAGRRDLFIDGVRDALGLPAWVVGFSLLGVGSLAREAGHPAAAAALSTVLIWASPAQVIFYAGLAAGTALPAIALAISLSSIRFVPMTMSILPLLRAPPRGLPTQLAIAHCVSVTVWVESLRRLPQIPPEQRLPYYFGFATACIGVSTAATYLGYYLVDALPVPLAAALLFLAPLFFALALVAGVRAVADGLAVGLGFALAPLATVLVGTDLDLLAAGLVGGTLAYGAGRVRRR